MWNDGKAKQLYQYVIGHWPRSDTAISARIGLAHIEFLFGSECQAERMLGALIGDSNNPAASPLEVLTQVALTY